LGSRGPKTTATSYEGGGLRACLNDLMGILTLPAMWSGRKHDHIVKTLLDAVRRTLELDFVYAQLSLPDGQPIEMIRFADSENANNDGLRQALRRWLRNDPGTRSNLLSSPHEDSDFTLAVFRLGSDEQTGVLVAGSHRCNFPSTSERFLLNIAADQATIGLREAQLLSEQRRVSKESKLKITRRKKELLIANEALRKENERRKAAEQMLRSVEARLSQAAQVAAAAARTTRSEVAELTKNYARLTAREREVLPFVLAGRLSKQTAAELGTSEITIRVHRGQIMRKMQAHSLAELIRMADKLGIH
jgi:DNA-binding CsgD family transcriptional regulator